MEAQRAKSFHAEFPLPGFLAFSRCAMWALVSAALGADLHAPESSWANIPGPSPLIGSDEEEWWRVRSGKLTCSDLFCWPLTAPLNHRISQKIKSDILKLIGSSRNSLPPPPIFTLFCIIANRYLKSLFCQNLKTHYPSITTLNEWIPFSNSVCFEK